MKSAAVLHGAGYVGGETIRLLLEHPEVELRTVASRAFEGQPVWKAHPHLAGQTDLVFSDDEALRLGDTDVIFIAAEHGQGARRVQQLLSDGYGGIIIDLSADHRFRDPAVYPKWFKFEHPAPNVLNEFVYGLVEVFSPYPAGTRLIANPGCFASGIALALWPVSKHVPDFRASVTALTGASGSGAQPSTTTHFPTRDGNVRAYKVLAHQHHPEVQTVVGAGAVVSFVPVSAPWTRGIWGTAAIELPAGVSESDVAAWFEAAYGSRPLVRLWPGELPELRYAVNTPFTDIGWVVKGDALVVGFAIDNLLKGAASQAIQNMNLLMGRDEALGLLPARAGKTAPAEVP